MCIENSLSSFDSKEPKHRRSQADKVTHSISSVLTDLFIFLNSVIRKTQHSKGCFLSPGATQCSTTEGPKSALGSKRSVFQSKSCMFLPTLVE